MTETTTKEKILIVDDDKFLIDMYSMKFSEEGFDVETCFNAKEVLEKIEAGLSPDICLIDIIMPGMDGFQLIEKLKTEGKCDNASVIILSNLGQKEDIDRGLSVGIDGYIVKASATPSEVVAKVREVIKNKDNKKQDDQS